MVVAGDFNVKFTSIELVHPPFSAQEAVWYETSRDQQVEADLRTSNFYMIGARPEVLFTDVDIEDGAVLSFELRMGEENLGRCYIDIYELEAVRSRQSESVVVSIGDKLITIADGGGDGENLDWFTVDKLAWDQSRGRPGLGRVSVPRALVTFDLLYVGIATKSDSYRRLIEGAHPAKAEILSNEHQRSPGARVADEVCFFLFRAHPLFVRTIGDSWTPSTPPPLGRVVADLEKAFISQLAPVYNRTRYKGYPSGTDGLATAGLDRYGYAIAEDLVFETAAGAFRGTRDAMTGFADGGDLLIVTGDDVMIVDTASAP